MHIFTVYIFHAGRNCTSYLKSAPGASWILSDISHVCTLLCTYLSWRIVCFLNILFKLQKETKGEKKRECTALQECPFKFKAIFRAHRFLLIVIDHHWWTLNEESDHSSVDSVWEVIVDRRNGDTGAWRGEAFLFASSLQ